MEFRDDREEEAYWNMVRENDDLLLGQVQREARNWRWFIGAALVAAIGVGYLANLLS
jgi:hypothetical protein